MIEQQPTPIPLEETAIQELASRLRGALIRPGDTGYEQARAVYNGMIDRRPSLIARCVDVADVIASVNFARDHQLTLAVRGGGKSWKAGLAAITISPTASACHPLCRKSAPGWHFWRGCRRTNCTLSLVLERNSNRHEQMAW
jgi:hypothetical protein